MIFLFIYINSLETFEIFDNTLSFTRLALFFTNFMSFIIFKFTEILLPFKLINSMHNIVFLGSLWTPQQKISVSTKGHR